MLQRVRRLLEFLHSLIQRYEVFHGRDGQDFLGSVHLFRVLELER